jgi:hypothetical protein
MSYGFTLRAALVSTALLSGVTHSTMAASTARSVAAGAKWEVDEITTLSSLQIGAGAVVSAAMGKSLSMTVNGVETAIKPGTYNGKVVLTPTANIPVLFNSMGMNKNYLYRVGLYVDDGVIVPGKSVLSAVQGKVSNTSANNVRIRSMNDRFNGIMIAGNTNYAIKNADIEFNGNGRNDFNGVGAGIRIGGTSSVTIDKPMIKNQGVVRTAIWVGDNANVTVNNANIEVHDGVMPKDYGWSWVKGGGGASGDVMMEVPWMLGLRGNNRATLVVGHGTATYNNSRVKAQRWGAMSTDAADEVRLNINNTTVETVESGYGAYSDGNSLVTVNGSTFNVADYGVILSGGSAVITGGSKINSRRFGVMAHGGNKGKLSIEKGSVINSEKAAIQLKGSSPTIVIDDAKLNSKAGLILQIMAHDDPNRQPGGLMAPGGAGDAATFGGMGAEPGAGTNAMLNTNAGEFSSSDGDDNADVTIKNTHLKGDFVNSNTSAGGMNITLQNAIITGAITTATAVHKTGPHGEKIVMKDEPDQYLLIGEQTETYQATADKDGAGVAVDDASTWVVTKTSYLTRLSIARDAKIVAPKGYQLVLTVDGNATPVSTGDYSGKIVLAVARK